LLKDSLQTNSKFVNEHIFNLSAIYRWVATELAIDRVFHFRRCRRLLAMRTWWRLEDIYWESLETWLLVIHALG